ARTAKSFKPTPPTERRQVNKVLDSCTGREETAHSVFLDAMREQDRRGQRGAATQNFTPERFKGMPLRKFGLGHQPGVQGRAAAFGDSAAPSASSGVAPRQVKEKKVGGSTGLMDLAFASGRGYAPVSLPYFEVAREELEQEDSGAAKQQSRPMLTRLDEANANAAKDLFLSKDGALQEHKYFLIQLPAVLPELLDGPDGEDGGSADAGSIAQYPDGLVGKLRVHKSGKVRMEIGGVPFCVDQGCETFFQQDLACVCPDEFYDLGAIRNRAILSPDVDTMLAAENKAGPQRGPAPEGAPQGPPP
ncbi:unnamed protein product, partial [Prorocentrum cordatum]